MRERAVASLTDDGLVSLDEMRNELSAALFASANRQRGESIREVTSMQALFGSSFVDGPNGMVPRFAAAACRRSFTPVADGSAANTNPRSDAAEGVRPA